MVYPFDPTVAQATVLSAVIGIASFTINYFLNKETQRTANANSRELAKLQAELTQAGTRGMARLDYEFEALKCLYESVEPLIFQMVDQSNGSMHRVLSLARTARDGSLSGPDSWIVKDCYYLRSTIYRIMAPLATFRLIQKKLTVVDLSLEPRINLLFRLSEQAYYSFTDDFTLAAPKTSEELNYKPNETGWEQNRIRDPKVYWRQGFPAGVLDQILDDMVVKDGNVLRVMSYGEYDNAAPISKGFKLASDVFISFHPTDRPVLWRVLLTQYYFQGAVQIAAACHGNLDAFEKEFQSFLTDGVARGISDRRGDDKKSFKLAARFDDPSLPNVVLKYVESSVLDVVRSCRVSADSSKPAQ